MISWLLALLASSQVPYELLALVETNHQIEKTRSYVATCCLFFGHSEIPNRDFFYLKYVGYMLFLSRRCQSANELLTLASIHQCIILWNK